MHFEKLRIELHREIDRIAKEEKMDDALQFAMDMAAEECFFVLRSYLRDYAEKKNKVKP